MTGLRLTQIEVQSTVQSLSGRSSIQSATQSASIPMQSQIEGIHHALSLALAASENTSEADISDWV